MNTPDQRTVCLAQTFAVALLALTAQDSAAQAVPSPYEPPPAGEALVDQAPPLEEAPAPAADPYGLSLTLSAERERQGDLRGAVRALQEVQAAFPQEPELLLRLGWLASLQGDSAGAERWYKEALRFSPKDPQAAFGLGLALLRQQRCGAAIPHLRAAGAQAQVALQHCQDVYPVIVSAGVAPSFLFYTPSGTSTTTRNPAVVLAANLELLLAERFALGLTYRGRFNAPSIDVALGLPRLAAQHELYLDAAYQAPRAGIGLTYAFIGELGGLHEKSHHIGLRGRVSPYGSLTLDLSGSFYSNVNDSTLATQSQTVLRGALAWYLPVRWGLALTPGVAFQYATGDSVNLSFGSMGSLTLSLTRPRFGLWVGAKYGNGENRPAYLNLSLVANYPETIKYGLWGGASVTLGDLNRSGGRGLWRLRLGYALDNLEAGTYGVVTGNSHTINLGLTRTF